MWINSAGAIYGGDMAVGDRATTAAEQTAYDLTHAKNAKLGALLAFFASKVAAGLPYGGKILQIGDADRANVAAQATRAAASLVAGSGVTWPSNFAWRMLDNTYLAMSTATAMLAMAAAASDRYTALRLTLGQIKDQITAAADITTVNAIDVTAGWPA